MKKVSLRGLDTQAAPASLADPETPANTDRLERIAVAAYYRAEGRGFMPGLEMDDWLKAEAEIDGVAGR
jgi:hypothetical protein